MKYMTKELFDSQTAGLVYWRDRWGYTEKVIEILKRYGAKSVLELGTNGFGVCLNSDTMERVDTYKPTVLHDAVSFPWPIADKQYHFFVALQVFEHLDPERKMQIQAFNECRRIADYIILSLPHKWTRADALHNNIDEQVVLKWTSGHKWIESYLVGIRKIYVWKS
jgi:hypothetical protein